MAYKIMGVTAGRKNSNSEILLKEALMACEELGAEVRMINLKDFHIEPCTGCTSCTRGMAQGKNVGCVLDKKDDKRRIMDVLLDQDAVIYSAPTYDLVSPEELRRIVKRRKLLLGHDRGNPVGFIGEHLEGSMGLLYVFPESRRHGYAVALEKAMIARTLKEGFIPFGQVEKGNHASLALQKKIGMTVSDNLICWMWK